MTHTVETLMALAASYSHAECSDYRKGGASSLRYRADLLKALTEALAPKSHNTNSLRQDDGRNMRCSKFIAIDPHHISTFKRNLQFFFSRSMM